VHYGKVSRGIKLLSHSQQEHSLTECILLPRPYIGKAVGYVQVHALCYTLLRCVSWMFTNCENLSEKIPYLAMLTLLKILTKASGLTDESQNLIGSSFGVGQSVVKIWWNSTEWVLHEVANRQTDRCSL